MFLCGLLSLAKIKDCLQDIAQKDNKIRNIDIKLNIENCYSFLFPRFLFHSNLKLSCRSGQHGILNTSFLIEVLFVFAADVNECTASPSACHVNAQCNNTISSYHCTCNPGYTGNGKTYTSR